MEYLCAKFGDFSFSRFGFIVPTHTHTHTHTHRQTDRQTELQRRIAILTPLSVGVSKWSRYRKPKVI